VNMFHAGGRPPADHSWLFCVPKAVLGDAKA
jgi:hypothetical protein